jgi:hypothetical protein
MPQLNPRPLSHQSKRGDSPSACQTNCRGNSRYTNRPRHSCGQKLLHCGSAVLWSAARLGAVVAPVAHVTHADSGHCGSAVLWSAARLGAVATSLLFHSLIRDNQPLCTACSLRLPRINTQRRHYENFRNTSVTQSGFQENDLDCLR